MPTMWMVRSGRGSEHVDAFLEHGVVAIGWRKLDELPPSIKKSDLLRLFAERCPGDREGTQASSASQVLRFVAEIKVDDQVVYDRDRRRYLLGDILSDCEWKPDLIEAVLNAPLANR